MQLTRRDFFATSSIASAPLLPCVRPDASGARASPPESRSTLRGNVGIFTGAAARSACSWRRMAFVVVDTQFAERRQSPSAISSS